MERARFVLHQGVEIFFIDLSDCSVEEIQEVVRLAEPQIRSRPEGSVLTLTYTDGGRFDNKVIGSLKEFTKGNEPYVKAAAVVGLQGLQKIVMDAVSIFSKREFALFDDIEKAKDYLADHT